MRPRVLALLCALFCLPAPRGWAQTEAECKYLQAIDVTGALLADMKVVFADSCPAIPSEELAKTLVDLGLEVKKAEGIGKWGKAMLGFGYLSMRGDAEAFVASPSSARLNKARKSYDELANGYISRKEGSHDRAEIEKMRVSKNPKDREKAQVQLARMRCTHDLGFQIMLKRLDQERQQQLAAEDARARRGR